MANEEVAFIDKLLEINIAKNFKIWHLLFIIGSTVFTILILLCCCIRFRIPRTKQEIEADFIRRKITRKFQKQLYLINDAEMDEMDLMKALERIRCELTGPIEEEIKENHTTVLETTGETLYKRSSTTTSAVMDVKTTVTADNAYHGAINNSLNQSNSEEKLLQREGSGFGTRLVTIVSALNVLRSRKAGSNSKSKQMTV